MPPAAPRRLRAVALLLGAWTLVGCVAVAGGGGGALSAGRPLPGAFFFVSNLVGMWLWALYTPLVLRLCERHPLDGPARGRAVAAHAGLFAALWSGELALGAALGALLGSAPRGPVSYFFAALIYCLFCYAGAAAVGHALRFHRLYLERAVHSSELESQLLRARLQALQLQLRPHFLFNALHTLSGLVRADDREGAQRVVVGLGDLLRVVLRGDVQQQVPVREEVELVERYLDIEQLRFQDRLRTELRVDPEALDALVPPLLLQPLVENAVRHGAGACERDGVVSVRVRCEAGRLHLVVEDSGAGALAADAPPPGARAPGVRPAPGGVGLANTRARLRHLYGDAQRLSLTRTPGGGTVAEVVIPLRRAEEAA